jgi:hypothetical protein
MCATAASRGRCMQPFRTFFFPMRPIFLLYFLITSIAGRSQDNSTLLLTKYGQWVQSKRPSTEILMSGFMNENKSRGLLIEIKCKENEDAIRSSAEADSIRFIAGQDSLITTNFLSDTSASVENDQYFVHWLFIFPLSDKERNFLMTKNITSIDLSYIYFPGWNSILIDSIGCSKIKNLFSK